MAKCCKFKTDGRVAADLGDPVGLTLILQGGKLKNNQIFNCKNSQIVQNWQEEALESGGKVEVKNEMIG
jgi:hypothetical protein